LAETRQEFGAERLKLEAERQGLSENLASTQERAEGLQAHCAQLESSHAEFMARAEETQRNLEAQLADAGARMESLGAEHQHLATHCCAWLRQRLARSVILNALRHPLAATRRWIGRIECFLMRMHAATLFALVRRLRGLRPSQSPMMNWYAYCFHNFKKRRARHWKSDLSSARAPEVPGLVSIVLPVYNGAQVLDESIASVIAQTYRDFELIVIDDGSTDETPRIADAWAARDPRVRVVHQENQKLPRSLSNGFRLARGEFLTWTSDDNRMKPDFLGKLVGALKKRPTVDMVYANVDIIDEAGHALRNSDWFSNYQTPPGSEHIVIPGDVAELNVWPNNYVGSAFMYRARVAHLLGDYSAIRFTTEDYDYWMRVNEFFTLRHAGIPDQVYEYRFHPKSLTSRDKELRITEGRHSLMAFDGFRRDFLLTPILWFVENRSTGAAGRRAARDLLACFCDRGDLTPRPGQYPVDRLPRLWMPAAQIVVADSLAGAAPGEAALPAGAPRILVYAGSEPLPESMDAAWDLCIATNPEAAIPRLSGGYRGWMRVSDAGALATCLDARVRSDQLRAIEEEIDRSRREPEPLRLSAIVCTYRRSDRLVHALESLCNQTMPREDYEILVVNNDPEVDLEPVMQPLRERFFGAAPDRLRLVVCPPRGLSFARNAGLSEARGRVCSFIDDDAIAQPEMLAHVAAAFESNPDIGVVGGKILLKNPDPLPSWWRPEWRVYWSHFEPSYAVLTRIENWWEWPWGANWSARRGLLLNVGGFRTQYGRRGNDFGGGEEVSLSSLARQVGMQVAIEPAAVVVHDVDPARFSLRHVRRTILAGMHANYQLQKDLCIPMQTTLHYTLYLALGRFFRALNDAWHGRRSQARDGWYFTRAYLSLGRWYLRDFYNRCRTPITWRDPKH
jgi:glycosyltransferase involved in cell wall biosynthesis